MTNWLVATDSISAATSTKAELEALGHQATVVAPSAIRSSLQDHAGVLLDASWGGALDAVTQLAAEEPSLAVIMLADAEHEADALASVRAGAADHVQMPVSRASLALTLDKIARRSPAPPPSHLASADDIVGSGMAMKQLMSKLARAARGTSTVLVQGESGTGKELIARRVHEMSPRAERPFVKVHCGALPDNLLESELFGYEKGAFTGADTRKPGRVELAEGGTLFLDEIGDISPTVQVKLLRVLQDRAYERLGGTETLNADVRFVSATHRDLKAMVKKGTFRQDLFYRLDVVRLVSPPLRSRSEDIPALVTRFVRDSAVGNGLPECTITDAAIARLRGFSWPGNVRQLQHIVERLVVMAEEPTITEEQVAAELADDGPSEGTVRGAALTAAETKDLTVQELKVALRIAERRALEKALKKAGPDRNLAARILGISRRKLFYMIKDHELS